MSGLQVFDRVQIQPRDAREASDVFYKQGQGDALLNYENEVIFTNKTYGDDRLPYVSPDNNVRVRHGFAPEGRESTSPPPAGALFSLQVTRLLAGKRTAASALWLSRNVVKSMQGTGAMCESPVCFVKQQASLRITFKLPST